VAGVMVAALLSSAWLGLMAASVLELIEYGVRTNSAILLAVAFNLLLALILYGVIRRKSRYLQFPAKLSRNLQTMPAGRAGMRRNHNEDLHSKPKSLTAQITIPDYSCISKLSIASYPGIS
jgi:hypothetical protein